MFCVQGGNWAQVTENNMVGRATLKEHKECVQKETTESDYNRGLEEEMALNREV